ncbi:protein RRP5 homolog [Bombina bombina]|uniref:protein RRP5 homolog n=1 Tax=Bombina bombina TaxID=8345 RepID=UPI00235A5B77|nr:protein RRP5 homolog [Bombina bombina]
MEESFPRGGTQKKTEEVSIKKRPKENDNLFSTHHEDEDEHKAKRKKKVNETFKITQYDKEPKSTTKDKPVELLMFKNLNVEMLFLGCVKEAKDFELVVSLPYGLTGFVHATYICDAYTKLLNEQVEKERPLENLSPLSSLYSPGMLIRCAVSSLDTTAKGGHSVKLSVNPKLVNKALSSGSLRKGMLLSGCVSSLEDHGYLIDIGVSGTKAFLPRQKAQAFLNQMGKGSSLKIGQYLNCVVEEVKNSGRIACLSISPSDVSAAIATEEQNWTLNNLLPGLVVRARIEKICLDNIQLSFISSYTGIVDFLHFEPKKSKAYKTGQEIKACILWLDPSSKTIRLTLRQSFLQPGNQLQQLSSDRLGTLLENCTVKALYKSAGAIFNLDETTLGFAFKHHLSVSKFKGMEKFKEGTTHTGRITDFSPMDEIHFISLKVEVIEGPYLRHSDLQAGQLVEGTVDSLEPVGMVVKITKHLTGLVPRLHLADVILRHPEKKYKNGSTLRCRILTVDPQARKLILTRKKTLINSKLPIISSYQDAKPGLVTHGVIVAIQGHGCVVKFYNDVHGLAPRRELGSTPIQFANKVFYKGQVVKVRVLECDLVKERMVVSFRMNETEDAEKHLKEKTALVEETGQIVDVRVVKKTDEGFGVVLPGDRPAFLPKIHLSDHVTICELLWYWLKEDDKLTGAMCLYMSSFQGKTTVTRKTSLISSVEQGHYVKDISELQVGMSLTGFVKNIMPYGVFVEIPCGLVGLVPRSEISDKFVTNTSEHFVIGQTVVAKVTNIDEEKKRFLLTLKMSECSPDDRSTESFARLSQCFTDLQLVKSLINNQEDPEADVNLSGLVPGKKLSLVVEVIQEDGSVLFSVSQISGAQTVLASKHHVGGKSVVPGQKVKVAVLHVDALKRHVHVSLLETLLKKRKETLEENATYSAVVQHVAEEFAVASLEGTSQLVAVPVTSHFNDTFRFESEKLKAGQEISLILKTTSTEDFGILLAVQKIAGLKTKKIVEQKKSTYMSNGLHLGQLVNGIVKSIKPTCVLVTINDNVVGRIHASQILEEVTVGSFPTSKLRPKQDVTCRVIGGKDVKTHRFLPITHPDFKKTVPELSILPSLMNTENKLPRLVHEKSFTAGQRITCFVEKYNKEKKYLEVEITPDVRGRVEVLMLSQSPKFLKRPEKRFKKGQALSATVIGSGACPRCISLSLTDTYSLVEGSVTLGCVKKVNPDSSLIVSLPFGNTGKANIFHLNDCLAEASIDDYTPGKFVRCCVLSVSKTIEVSLRKSRTNPKMKSKVVDPEITSIEHLEEGQLVNGFVSSISEKGVFFRISSSIVGRILFEQVTDFYVPDISVYKKYIPEGTLLTAKIISTDTTKNHVALSLLPEETGKPDVIPESAKLNMKNKTDEKKRKRTHSESKTQAITKKKKKSQVTKEDDDSGVDICGRDEEDDKVVIKQKEKEPNAVVSRLKVSSGFSWDVDLNTLKTALTKKEDRSDSDDDEEEDEQPKKKKSKKEKEMEKITAEKEISKIEATLMDPNRQPQSADDFDKLVLSSPNSSILWLQYMAFHLHATEIEKARAVAERALKTISFREEQEKLNVWVALLNLENMYGTEDTLLKVFERAVQYNEPIKVFHQLADIYIKSEKFKQAEDLYKTMVKRFRQEKSVWLKYATFLLRQGQPEATHRLLQHALKCLPDKEHVEVISKFAQLEFNLGDKERAKAMFESTLSSYPKRTDLWSVYIDMMMKHGSQKEVRDIFERVIHLSLAAKRVKFFFKRYLEYEKKHGTAESVQAVKEKALEYVESQSSLQKHSAACP